jgi:hypothetical protein
MLSRVIDKPQDTLEAGRHGADSPKLRLKGGASHEKKHVYLSMPDIVIGNGSRRGNND